jgi:drug/metabolite transporter (DMT)-like permease
LSVTPEPSTRPLASSAARSSIERGMMLMAIGALTAPTVHAIAKSLGETMSAGQTAWARFFFQLFVLLPLLWLGHGRRIPPPSPAHAIRGLLLASASVLFIAALHVMPIANSAAIFFVEPLLLTAISAMFLGEPIGWRRLTAVGVGFIGALIVIRPSFEAVGFAALLPLLSALCFAVYLAITRHQLARETALATQFWVSAVSAGALSVALVIGTTASLDVFQADVFGASWPTPMEWGLLGAMAAIAMLTQSLAIQACRLAPASILAPFQYLEIFGSIMLGALFFGDLPDKLTALGTAIIIGSGLYVFRREQRVARKIADG